MDIEIRQLRILRAVAESGSLARASATLGMSQGSLSRHLQRLERAVGLPLLERHPAGVTLTDTGELLLGKADIALPMVDRLLVAARGYSEQQDAPATIRVGASHSAVLSHVIRSVDEALPGTEITLRVDDSLEALVERLRERQLELAVLRRFPEFDEEVGDTVDHVLITEERARLVVSDNHPLARKDQASIRDLHDLACVLPDPDRHSLSRHLLSLCTPAEVRPRVSYTSDPAAAEAVVAATASVTVAHQPTHPTPGLQTVPLSESALSSQLLLAWAVGGVVAPHAPFLTELITTTCDRVLTA